MPDRLARYGLTEDRLLELFNVLERFTEDRYGIRVSVRDVPAPFTGDLNGAEIHIDYEENPESALFILAHLFGHTVQWNLSERARVIGEFTAATPTPELLAELEAYEVEACRYSLQLFHEAGITELDQWVSDFAACDFKYLRHVYTTGERVPFRTFWEHDQPRLTPLAVPPFEPANWSVRWSGTVV